MTGVVSTRADPYDVYAVTLAAGGRLTIQLAPLTPFENYFAAKARVSLLKPGTATVQSPGNPVAGPAEAVAASVETNRETATLQYTPAEGGTYYVVVEAGPFVEPLYGMDFAYRLTTSGNGASAGGGGSSGETARSPMSRALPMLAPSTTWRAGAS